MNNEAIKESVVEVNQRNMKEITSKLEMERLSL